VNESVCQTAVTIGITCAFAQRIEVAEGSSDHGIARWIAAGAGRRIKRGIG
jgi:hypothetical protein